MPDMTPDERFDKRLREIVQSTRSPVPEAQRLERLLREFRELHPRPSFLGRLANWFARPHRIPAPAIAFVTVLLVAQGVALVALMPEREAAERYRGVAGKCEDGPRIRAVFKPDAPHVEVVVLLRKADASITAGPSETGELWLSIPKGRSLDEALAVLKSSKLV